MDIKELDKKQLILLTLLITFVVSIATGIITVSLMNQMPKSVPQTINNVIQRTIEKVNTIEVPAKDINGNTISSSLNSNITTDSNVLIPIYSKNANIITNSTDSESENKSDQPLGYGVIISEAGLILVDSNVVPNKNDTYKITLDNINFDASILKEFNNGFVVLKISPIKDKTDNVIVNDSTKKSNADGNLLEE